MCFYIHIMERRWRILIKFHQKRVSSGAGWSSHVNANDTPPPAGTYSRSSLHREEWKIYIKPSEKSTTHPEGGGWRGPDVRSIQTSRGRPRSQNAPAPQPRRSLAVPEPCSARAPYAHLSQPHRIRDQTKDPVTHHHLPTNFAADTTFQM